MLGVAAIIGLCTAFSFIVLKMKFAAGRYGDMAMDFIALIILTAIFGNTIMGMMIAVVASTVISVYLFFSPPSLG